MISVLAPSAVDFGFEPRSGQTKDYNICICCFSAKHAALMRKSKKWLDRNQNNVSGWSNMSTRGLLFQWASTIKTNSACWSSTKRTSSSSHWKLTCSRHDIAENCWIGVKQQSLTHSSVRDICVLCFVTLLTIWTLVNKQHTGSLKHFPDDAIKCYWFHIDQIWARKIYTVPPTQNQLQHWNGKWPTQFFSLIYLHPDEIADCLSRLYALFSVTQLDFGFEQFADVVWPKRKMSILYYDPTIYILFPSGPRQNELFIINIICSYY
jgi:hypothetical protein